MPSNVIILGQEFQYFTYITLLPSSTVIFSFIIILLLLSAINSPLAGIQNLRIYSPGAQIREISISKATHSRGYENLDRNTLPVGSWPGLHQQWMLIIGFKFACFLCPNAFNLPRKKTHTKLTSIFCSWELLFLWGFRRPHLPDQGAARKRNQKKYRK